MAIRAPNVVVVLGAGLGGPKLGEDFSWPWLVLLWWLEDSPHSSLGVSALRLGFRGRWAPSWRRLPLPPDYAIPEVT